MTRRRIIGVHACWADRECRGAGCPAFTYVHLWWFTIRINPLRENLDGRWDWRLLQAWRQVRR